jgi:hypothetical protein
MQPRADILHLGSVYWFLRNLHTAAFSNSIAILSHQQIMHSGYMPLIYSAYFTYFMTQASFGIGAQMSQEYVQMLINMQQALDNLQSQTSSDTSSDSDESPSQHSVHLSDNEDSDEDVNNTSLYRGDAVTNRRNSSGHASNKNEYWAISDKYISLDPVWSPTLNSSSTIITDAASTALGRQHPPLPPLYKLDDDNDSELAPGSSLAYSRDVKRSKLHLYSHRFVDSIAYSPALILSCLLRALWRT